MRQSPRRIAIAEATLDLAAAGGSRAITHTAVDRHLELPAGSTSYYYRTRAALLGAALTRLTERSRAEFIRHFTAAADSPPAQIIAQYLHHLVHERRRDVIARYALVPEVADDPNLRAELAQCFFSLPAATELWATLQPDSTDHDVGLLIAALEGLVFDTACGRRAAHPPGIDTLRAEVTRLLPGE